MDLYAILKQEFAYINTNITFNDFGAASYATNTNI